MDHVTIDEQNVAERYLMGKLGAAEEARFVEHYLDCPECLDKLELTRRLYEGLQEIAAKHGAREVVRLGLLGWLARRGRMLQLGLAAGLLAMLVLPWAWLGPRVTELAGEHRRLAAELRSAFAPQAGTPVYVLSPERSRPDVEPNTRITLTPAPEWVVLSLQLPPEPVPAELGVRLIAATGEPLWHGGGLRPDAGGRITFSVHSTWLEPGNYTVELEAPAAGAETSAAARFTFQVRRAEAAGGQPSNK